MKRVPKKRTSTLGKKSGATGRQDVGWPVRLDLCESAIRQQDDESLQWTIVVDEIVRETESRVEARGETNDLEFLCSEGCPRRELLYMLGMCENRGVTNSVRMSGFDSSDLTRLLRDMRRIADDLWALSGYEICSFLEDEECAALFEFLRVPKMLHEYASLVEHAVKYLGGKSDFYLHLAKSLLVKFVRRHTGADHDVKVASLLSVMLGENYGEVNHRMWRLEYERRASHFEPDPADSDDLRAKKTLLECSAAVNYRCDIHHPGTQYLRQGRRTIVRDS